MIRRWWQRFVDKHAPLIDWPEIGDDDEPCGYLPADDLMAVADAVQDEDGCSDPNRHWNTTGCRVCRDRLMRIRVMVEMGRADNFARWAQECGVDQ